MKIFVRIIIGIFILNFSNVENVDAQNSNVMKLTLSQAQEYAVNYSYEIKNSRLDLDIAEKKVWETTAIGLPQVSGSVEYQNMLDIPTQIMPDFITPAIVGVNKGLFDLDPVNPVTESQGLPVQFGSQHNLTWGVTATQLIFSGEYIVALKASKAFLQISKNALLKSEIDIKQVVTNTYYMTLIANENVKILKSSYENTEKILAEMKEMLKVGFIEETDVDQLQITSTSLKNKITVLERQVKLSENMLKFQMGLDLVQSIELTENLVNILEQVNIEAIYATEFDVNNHVDYKMLLTQENISMLSLKREKSLFLPTLAAYYTYQKNAQRSEFDFFDSSKEWYPTSIVGVKLDIPIFSSGMKLSKVSQAKMELDKVKNSKYQVKQGLSLAAEKARIDFTNTYETYNSEKQNMELAKKIYDKTQIKYKEGLSSSLDLTQVQNQYFTTQSSYFNAMLALLNAKTELEKALSVF